MIFVAALAASRRLICSISSKVTGSFVSIACLSAPHFSRKAMVLPDGGRLVRAGALVSREEIVGGAGRRYHLDTGVYQPVPHGQAQTEDSPATLRGMSADAPKSAYELAMERLRQKDKEASVEERPLTDEQKAAIAEARQFHQAKAAEREILHQAALAAARTHEEVDKLNEELRRDQERLAKDRDRKIAEIRSKKSH